MVFSLFKVIKGGLLTGQAEKKKQQEADEKTRRQNLWFGYFNRLFTERTAEKYMQTVYAGVRCFSFDHHEVGKYFLKPEYRDNPYMVAQSALNIHQAVIMLLAELSPAQIAQMFPQAKEYDGQKYQCKDWFYSQEAIKKFGNDKPLGGNIRKTDMFLWEQNNRYLNNFVIAQMLIVSELRELEGEPSLMEEFLNTNEKETGKHIEPMYVADGKNGKILVDKSGRKLADVEKPKPRWARKARVNR